MDTITTPTELAPSAGIRTRVHSARRRTVVAAACLALVAGAVGAGLVVSDGDDGTHPVPAPVGGRETPAVFESPVAEAIATAGLPGPLPGEVVLERQETTAADLAWLP